MSLKRESNSTSNPPAGVLPTVLRYSARGIGIWSASSRSAVDPGVNRIQTQQAPSEKSGGHEQHQRQSHLRHDERRTKPTARGPGGRRPSSVADDLHDVETRELQRRQDAEDERCRQRDEHGEADHCPVERDVLKIAVGGQAGVDETCAAPPTRARCRAHRRRTTAARFRSATGARCGCARNRAQHGHPVPSGGRLPAPAAARRHWRTRSAGGERRRPAARAPVAADSRHTTSRSESMVSPQPAMHRQFLAERLLQCPQVGLRLVRW